MLNPWVRSGKGFFTIEIGHEIFSRAIFSLPLVFSYWLKQKIKTISYSSSSLLKKLASLYEQSRIMRKHTFLSRENKGADQLRGNPTAAYHLYFRL